MKFNTAICIIVLSAAVLSLNLKAKSLLNLRQRLPLILSSVSVIIGLLTLLEYLFQLDFGIDTLFVSDFLNDESKLYPGRMSPIAAGCLTMMSAGILFTRKRGSEPSLVATFFVLPALFASSMSLVGYMYQESSLYQFGPFIRVSWETALCCFLLSFSILISRPQVGPVQVLTSPGPGGMIARRLFPIVLIAPVFMGFLWLKGRRAGVLDRELGVSLFVVAVISIFLFGISVVAKRLDQLELERKNLLEKDELSQKALAASEIQFRMMANSISQLAWMANKDGWVFWFNERWYDYTGSNFKSMEGWNWQSALDKNDFSRVRASWQASLESGKPWEETFAIVGKNGERRWFLTRARPMFSDTNNIIFWFGTNTDIDEQLKTERALLESKEIAEKASMAKTQFLANMSHEIRTPIGAIMGFTDMLKSASETERLSYMTVIERNSQNLLRLIDDILDLSKVEAGKVALEIRQFSFPDFLYDLKATMTLLAEEKGIIFTLKIGGLVPSHISTDQLRLRQILTNLIGNAIKFTEHGSVKLDMQFDKPRLIFTVTDTGVGIEEESQEKLFHAFSQADVSMTRRFGGTGLGLVLSKRLSHALGGDVLLKRSALNFGSIFEATILPMIEPNTGMVNSESFHLQSGFLTSSKETKAVLKSLKVLIVDDAIDNRTLVSLYLRNTGASVTMASDGEEAVEVALADRPDVILMDIQMPKMDGRSATRKLRSLGFSKPIVALTAHAMREERDRCFEAGCSDYLTKPIQKDVLIATLKRFVDKTL